jgi:hypothetical protein
MAFIRALLVASLAALAVPVHAATVTQCGPNVC